MAGQLHALAAELAASITPSMTMAVSDLLADVLGAGRQLELASCRLMERADRSGEYAADGAGSAVEYVRSLSGESAGWAALRLRIGRALADGLPATSAAWEAGNLGLAHAQVIAKAVDGLAEPLSGELERALADATPALAPSQLSSLAEVIRSQQAPDAAAGKAGRRRARQKLTLSQTLDGMWRLDGWLDPQNGAMVAAAIASFTRRPALDPAGRPDPADPIGLRRAEALVELARHATSHADSCVTGGGGGRHTVLVTVGLTDLQSGLGAAGLIGTDVTLTAAAARRLACDAQLIPAVLGANSQLLDFGRSTRLISPGLRAYLAARDGGCLFPGCDRPPS